MKQGQFFLLVPNRKRLRKKEKLALLARVDRSNVSLQVLAPPEHFPTLLDRAYESLVPGPVLLAAPLAVSFSASSGSPRRLGRDLIPLPRVIWMCFFVLG